MEEIAICCIAFLSVVYLMPPSIDSKTRSRLIDIRSKLEPLIEDLEKKDASFRKRIEGLEKKIAELEKEKRR